MKISKLLSMTGLAAVLGLGLVATNPASAAKINSVDVVKTYADIAHAMYSDALLTAEDLSTAVSRLLASPTDAHLKAARDAWISARAPYQQTEGVRFGNPVVDAWEGQVNSWPLDEGLIDYVDPSYGTSSDANPAYTLNVIANRKIRIGPKVIDATHITKELLSGALHEAQEVEANVATGYHAIEFLLWGQDLNGTDAGAGNRPATDFDMQNCTGGNCDRRGAFLAAATDLLVDDLKEIVAAWAPGGEARQDIMAENAKKAYSRIMTGLGSLSYGELAGERLKLGLILHDPEEEHDCFSDNTHNSHYNDQVGMISLFNGYYRRVDGSVVSGASLADVAASVAPARKSELDKSLSHTLAKMQVMKDMADSGEMAYDQMIGEDNQVGNKIIQDVVDGLVRQTRSMEKLVTALELNINVEGSDSLDNPNSVK